MVPEIAHQGCVPLGLMRCGDLPPIRILFKKIHMAPCRTSIRLPFPTSYAGSCLVDRRAMPPLTTEPASDG
jgi:hypothetical protein